MEKYEIWHLWMSGWQSPVELAVLECIKTEIAANVNLVMYSSLLAKDWSLGSSKTTRNGSCDARNRLAVFCSYVIGTFGEREHRLGANLARSREHIGSGKCFCRARDCITRQSTPASAY